MFVLIAITMITAWFNFNFIPFMRLEFPWNILMAVIATITSTISYIDIYLNPRKYTNFMVFRGFKDAPKPYNIIIPKVLKLFILGCILCLCIFIWYIDWLLMPDMDYINLGMLWLSVYLFILYSIDNFRRVV